MSFNNNIKIYTFLYGINYRKCPVCDNISTKWKYFLKDNHQYQIDICKTCGCVFQNNIYNEEYYHSLPCSYPEDYAYHSIERANYIIQFYLDNVNTKESISILDIGSGKGGTLYHIASIFERMSVNVENSIGITLEKDIFKEEYKNFIYQFDIENDDSFNDFLNEYKDTKFNFIIMSHVLEHFINPSKVIQNVKKMLAPDGVLYIEVPSLYNAEYRVKSVWTSEHLSYFTATSLFNLLRQNNFYNIEFNDSKIWGNIKTIWKLKTINKIIYKPFEEKNIIKKYNSNKFKKFIQRLKHKIGFNYEANI